jgi:hypothetical protein
MGRGDHDRVDLQFLATLLSTNADVAGDVVQINAHTWAIHGSIPVDGEVLLAEYEDPADAADALHRIAPGPITPRLAGPPPTSPGSPLG